MSKSVTPRPRVVAAKRTIAIVASQYNPKYVQGLVDHASREIYALIPNVHIDFYQVPGAFEIPLLVQEIARKGNADAIIALGVIIQGETGHAGHIASAVTDALLRVSLEQRVPVIHEVLSVQNEEQAVKRCLDDELNRGTEAARVAVQYANIFRDFLNK